MQNRIIQLWAHNFHNSEKTHNGAQCWKISKNLFISYAFFILWEIHGKFFPRYGTFSQQIATVANFKHSTKQGIPGVLIAAGRLGHVLLFLYNAPWFEEKKPMTAWKRKKPSAWIWRQNNFLFRVFTLKMDKFRVKPKKKPCSITPQEPANQYPEKFHASPILLNLQCCRGSAPKVSSWQSPFSFFTHRANEWILFEASKTTDKFLSSAKLQHRKRKWKAAMSG